MTPTQPSAPESPRQPAVIVSSRREGTEGRPTELSRDERRQAFRQYASNALPRVVGYGLLAMFSFDIVQLAIGYKPLQADADANFVAQVLERIAVPLLAYALIFLLEVPPHINRLERAVRKTLSFGSLVWIFLCLALSALSVVSCIRLYRQTNFVFQQQLNQRLETIKRVQEQLPKVNDPQLTQFYNEFVRQQRGVGTPNASVEQKRQEILAAVPASIETETNLNTTNRRTAITALIVSATKYALCGLISAILFFVAWEASYPARIVRVFRHRSGGSNMMVEDTMVSGIERFMIHLSEFSPLPNFNDYRWYRRIKRTVRRWRGKDH